jgi:hypothetical protein
MAGCHAWAGLAVIYLSGADYEKFIRDLYVKEKEIIEKLGLLKT